MSIPNHQIEFRRPTYTTVCEVVLYDKSAKGRITGYILSDVRGRYTYVPRGESPNSESEWFPTLEKCKESVAGE